MREEFKIEVCVAIKNYKKPLGFSSKVHSDSEKESIYEIKGPMGKGINLKKYGTQVAFTAGTGILVFIDLVAYLVR